MDTARLDAPLPASASTPFGMLLRQYRLAAGLSQEALAERAGLSVQGLSALENGRRQTPYRHTIGLLADALCLDGTQRATLETAVARRRAPPSAEPQTPSHPDPARPALHNLPAPTTALIGRGDDVARAVSLLQRPEVRLLTLTGVGGIGKTRLALQIARTLLQEAAASLEGAWLVDLAPLADPALLTQTLAATLGLRELSDSPLPATLARYLADRRLLLILDNCEHLIDACAELAGTLLRACLHLRLLATSREALAIEEETVYRVAPLSFPDPAHLPAVEALATYPAVTLLLHRARARGAAVALTAHTAPAVAQICARLDGIPLALELAAARLSAVPPAQVAARLDDCFALLTAGWRSALPRHQTLRATLDWSYELLSAPEQVLLRRLAVFAGGWTLEAAETICADDPASAAHWDRSLGPTEPAAQAAHPHGARSLAEDAVLDVLAGLVDKSLIVLESARAVDGATPAGEERYRLLETVRQYAREKLDAAAETARLRDRHLAWYLVLAEEAAPGITGSEQVARLDRLDVEHDNLRAALLWAQESPGSHETGLRLAGALWRFWALRGHLSEGRTWLESVLALSLNDAPAPSSGPAIAARAAALDGAGGLANRQGDYARARVLFEESLALRRRLGDTQGSATALYNLGNLLFEQREYSRARTLHEESLSLRRRLGDRRAIADSLLNLGYVPFEQGDTAQAGILFQEGLLLARELDDKRQIAYALRSLGRVALEQGNTARAVALFQESLVVVSRLGDTWLIASALEGLACAVATTGGVSALPARLLGAAATLRATIEAPLPPFERRQHESTVAALHVALDAETYTAAWAEGQALTREQALALALGALC